MNDVHCLQQCLASHANMYNLILSTSYMKTLFPDTLALDEPKLSALELCLYRDITHIKDLHWPNRRNESEKERDRESDPK